jgi:hypothetical protein
MPHAVLAVGGQHAKLCSNQACECMPNVVCYSCAEVVTALGYGRHNTSDANTYRNEMQHAAQLQDSRRSLKAVSLQAVSPSLKEAASPSLRGSLPSRQCALASKLHQQAGSQPCDPLGPSRLYSAIMSIIAGVTVNVVITAIAAITVNRMFFNLDLWATFGYMSASQAWSLVWHAIMLWIQTGAGEQRSVSSCR